MSPNRSLRSRRDRGPVLGWSYRLQSIVYSPQGWVDATRTLCSDPSWGQAAAELQIEAAQAEQCPGNLLAGHAARTSP